MQFGLKQMQFLVDSRLILDASQSLNVLAKAVAHAGEAEKADTLFQKAADLELASPELQNCWGGPFNGQSGRQALVLDLLRILDPVAVVETGTFRGITTEWLARHYSGRILTCENEKLYYLQAKARLSHLPNVTCREKDSRLFLREILTKLPADNIVMFYLDANWTFDLSLREELQIIFASHSNAVVIIDDFKVPDDIGYRWDDYGVDKSLDVSLLDGAIPFDSEIFFPSLHSGQETGAARGCCVIASDAATKVGESVLLRGNSLEHWLHIEQNSASTADGDGSSPKIPLEADRDDGAFQVRQSPLAESEKDRKQLLDYVHGLTREVQRLQLRLAEYDKDRTRHLSDISTLTVEVERLLRSQASEARHPLVAKVGGRLRLIRAVARLLMPFSRLLQDIEAKLRRRGSGELGELDKLSDGEFVLNIAELLFPGQAATPKDVEFWKRLLKENRKKRVELVRSLLEAHVVKQRQDGEATNDPDNCWIMGTDRYLTQSTWQEKATELRLRKLETLSPRPTIGRRRFEHSGNYAVSAIASLYKGRRYIENFLENITSQTIFDQSELIIIDADSPEEEFQIIAEYQKQFPNIIYKRINYRIGVYDAWNVGVQIARGRYLSNTNLDDLRRRDSFELQAAALDRHSFVDVVYQDFFYSFDASLSFDEVAMFGFKSDLPIITPHNLLAFNSPHNAPMWRKTLHEEVGLFDTSFKSASDYEFWLRCLWKGKSFFKINTPHVVYFQNPEGISTRPDSRGIEEARRILRRYSRKLISTRLLMSRQAFAEILGIIPDWDWGTSCYDVVQSQLKLLGDRHKADAHGA